MNPAEARTIYLNDFMNFTLLFSHRRNPLIHHGRLLALSGLLLTAGASHATTAIHVLLVGGQSNADGRADPAGLPTSPVNLQNPQADVPYYYTSPLTTLRPRATQFGPEITFGRSLADFYAPFSEKVAVVKYAAGGTNLYSQWKAGGDATTTGDGPFYQSFQSTINAGLAALRSANPDAILILEGMIWVQGESDIDAGAATSAAYGANLTQLIADVRATFLPNLPFFLSRISSKQTVYSAPGGSKYNNYLTLRAQQESVANNVAGAYLIDTDGAGFTMNGDNLHFGPGGQQALGYAFASAMQAVVPAPGLKVQGLTATSMDGSITLAWDVLSGANSYNVKRSTSVAGSYTSLATGLATPTYTDASVVGGETYLYVVTAVSGGVETENSWPFSKTAVAHVNSQAAILKWDPLQSTTSSDGAGAWNEITENFAAGGDDFAYTPTPAGSINVAAFAAGATTITVASSSSLVVGHGISLTQFPAGTKIANISGTTLTMSAAATTALASTTATTFAPIHSVVFGAGIGAAGTVTLAGLRAANAMTLNPAGSGSYTFTGGSIILGTNIGSPGALTVNSGATINSAFKSKGIVFAAAGRTLALAGGSAGISGSVSGSTVAIAAASTLSLTGVASYTSDAPYNIGNVAAETGGLVVAAPLTTNGTFQFGNAGTGLVTVISGGAITNGSSGIVVGRGGATNVGKLVVAGGSISTAGTTPWLIGFQSGSGTVNVTNGILTAAGDLGIGVSSSSGSAALNIRGGTVTANKVDFGKGGTFVASTGGSGDLTMTGGTLYVGSGGIVKDGSGTYTNTISLSGGTVGATANWTSDQNMALGTTGGNITFQAANAAGSAFNIGLSGVLSGSGGLVKTGGGLLTLSGAITYQGDTSVSSGTLVIGTANSNNESSTVTIAASGAALQLDYTGTDTVGKLYIGTTPAAIGVYGALASGAQYKIAQITGTGTLTVTATGGNYASWATANGISGEPASGDFDKDGLTNLVEYAMGLNPKVSSQPPGTFTDGTLTFTKGSDAIGNIDVDFVIETSTTLSGLWTPVVTQNAPDASTTISYTLPPSMPKIFARLKVTSIP